MSQVVKGLAAYEEETGATFRAKVVLKGLKELGVIAKDGPEYCRQLLCAMQGLALKLSTVEALMPLLERYLERQVGEQEGTVCRTCHGAEEIPIYQERRTIPCPTCTRGRQG